MSGRRGRRIGAAEMDELLGVCTDAVEDCVLDGAARDAGRLSPRDEGARLERLLVDGCLTGENVD